MHVNYILIIYNFIFSLSLERVNFTGLQLILDCFSFEVIAIYNVDFIKNKFCYEFTKFFIPSLILPLKPTKTIKTSNIYGTTINMSIPEFNPLPHCPPLFSTTALQFEHNAKDCSLMQSVNNVNNTFLSILTVVW